jgi:hypothetical protein
MPTTIYLVVAGYYSDYHVEAVFDNVELAKRYIDEKEPPYDGEFRIETRALNASANDNGFLYRVEVPHSSEQPAIAFVEDDNSLANCFRYDDFVTVVFVRANNREHAKKIATERLFYINANPALYPKFKHLCVSYLGKKRYPTYNFKTCQIVLLDKEEGLW